MHIIFVSENIGGFILGEVNLEFGIFTLVQTVKYNYPIS